MQTRECAEIVVFIQSEVTSQEIRDSDMPKTKSIREVQKQAKVQNQKIISSEVQIGQVEIVVKKETDQKAKTRGKCKTKGVYPRISNEQAY